VRRGLSLAERVDTAADGSARGSPDPSTTRDLLDGTRVAGDWWNHRGWMMQDATGQSAGKVVPFTRGNAGIGRATPIAFAKQRAQVVMSGRRETDAEAAILEIKESGGEEVFVKTDVSKEGDISSMIRRTLARFGRLDCAFSAGIEQSLTRPLLSTSSTVSVEDECDRESRGRSSQLSWW
jgi:Enoyl-(Acyl carrier protein) reductase